MCVKVSGSFCSHNMLASYVGVPRINLSLFQNTITTKQSMHLSTTSTTTTTSISKQLLRVITLATVLHHITTGVSAARWSHKETEGREVDADKACVVDYLRDYNHTVFVDPTTEDSNNNSSSGSVSDCNAECFHEQRSVTCPNINAALQLHDNSTAYVLASGDNIVHYLKQDTGDSATFFRDLVRIGFFGKKSDNTGTTTAPAARVECLDASGLAFWNSDDIRIHNVHFSSCGALRKSTNLDFTKHDDHPPLSPAFTQVRTALYFFNGSDVTLCGVTVRNYRAESLGVVMYDIDGTVNVYLSNFTNNTVLSASNFSRPGGGGFYVEFSFCVPGDRECGKTSFQSTHNANSSYTFYRSRFVGNVAKARDVNRLIFSNATHAGFGRGGGLAVFFKGSARGNLVRMLDCTFTENRALWGGALSVGFIDAALGNVVLVEGSEFRENACDLSAGIGGGAIRVLSVVNFEEGDGGSGGGGGGGGGSMLHASAVEGNRVNITNSTFVRNAAQSGGAISFSPAYQTQFRMESATALNLSRCTFEENRALLGAAVHVELHPLFVEGVVNYVVVESCDFRRNTISYTTRPDNYDIGIGVVYAFQVPLRFLSRATFADNYGSALAMISTYASFVGTNATFVGNRADKGGAIAFLGSSHVLVGKETRMHFERNFARVGGALYNHVTAQAVMKSNVACIIRYNEPLEDRRAWKAKFTFVGNLATLSIGAANSPNSDRSSSSSLTTRPNSLYSTSIYPCTLYKKVQEEDGFLNDSLLFCVNENWHFVNSSCMEEIQTQGKAYTFTNRSVLTTFPGRGIELPIAVRDDLNHNVTDSTGYTSSVSAGNDGSARVDPKFTLTSGNFLVITGQENSTVQLDLQSSGSRPHHLTVEVHLQECPPGFYLEEGGGGGGGGSDGGNSTEKEEEEEGKDRFLGRCQCRSTFSFLNNLNCSMQNFQAQIPWNYWIGVMNTANNNNNNTDATSTELFMCEIPNMYGEQDNIAREADAFHLVLPKSYSELDEAVCGARNRTGTICGECKENFSTSVNSYNYVCTRCDGDTNLVKNVFVFLAFAYVPYVVLLGVIVFFNFKFTSSSTSGFILFAQMISLGIFDVNGSSRIAVFNPRMHKAYLFVYGLFNFNSFANVMEPFCIHRNFNTLDVLLLEYTLAVLPLFLILVWHFLLRCKSVRCMCCQKPVRLSIQSTSTLSTQFSRLSRNKHHRRKKNRSLIHGLVSFILLSYTKFSLVSMKMLATLKLFDRDGHYASDTRIQLAGHFSYYSHKYWLPYGLVAVFVTVFFVVIPTLFLLGLPQLIDRLLDKRRLSCFRRAWPAVTIHIFLDAFQGFYKPNRRLFAGVYFVFRLLIILVYACTTTDILTMYILQQVFVLLMIVLLAIFKPYKREIFNVVDILIFLTLAIINSISTYVYASSQNMFGLEPKLANFLYVIQYCFIWLPLVYMLLYLGYKCLEAVGIRQVLAKRFPRRFGDWSPSERDRLFFTNNSDFEETRRDSKSLDESKEEEVFEGLDSLSDDAMFYRAKETNLFRPPTPQQQLQQHGGTRKMQSVVDGSRPPLPAAATLSSSEFDTESTENGTYSTDSQN